MNIALFLYLLMLQSLTKCNVSGKYVSLFARGFSSFSALCSLGHQTARTLTIQRIKWVNSEKRQREWGRLREEGRRTKHKSCRCIVVQRNALHSYNYGCLWVNQTEGKNRKISSQSMNVFMYFHDSTWHYLWSSYITVPEFKYLNNCCVFIMSTVVLHSINALVK